MLRRDRAVTSRLAGAVMAGSMLAGIVLVGGCTVVDEAHPLVVPADDAAKSGDPDAQRSTTDSGAPDVVPPPDLPAPDAADSGEPEIPDGATEDVPEPDAQDVEETSDALVPEDVQDTGADEGSPIDVPPKDTPDVAPPPSDVGQDTGKGPEVLCSNGEDDDADYLADCADPDCDGVDGCEAGKEQSCGDGADNDGDGMGDCLDPDCDGVAGCELGAEQSCGDGQDNDGDGAADCLDADCKSAEGCEAGKELTCFDEVDNDGDGSTDCLDPDCDGKAGCELLTELSCADGMDNDADGAKDCKDLDCDGLEGCEHEKELSCDDGKDNDTDGSPDCKDPDCNGAGGCEVGKETTCDDGLDNDGDDLVDCLDPSCHGKSGCELGKELTCIDGKDNDSDGAPDCTDPDCNGKNGCEVGKELSCADEADNDGDGTADCLDPDCNDVGGCEVGAEKTCGDGDDNDTDGLADCLDPDCNGLMGCEVGKEVTCSDGLDNDVDGKADCHDVDCNGVWKCEYDEESSCTDDYDNDADGLVDCLDADCAGKGACEPGAELTCNDGLDNDADGWTDCADYSCDGVQGCEYGFEKTCGDAKDNDGDGKPDCGDDDCYDCNGACCGPGWYCEFQKCKVICTEGAQCGAEDDTCCKAGELCIGDKCVTPSGSCKYDEDCAPGHFCETVLGQCISEDLVEVCEYVPPVGVLKPVMGCHWTPPSWAKDKKRDNVCMNPVVANLTDDNGDGVTNRDDIPDIAFTAWDHSKGSCCNQPATLWIVSGKCTAAGGMTTIAELHTPDLDESAGLAIGDLNGDGVPEIVGMTLTGGSVAWERKSPDGKKWAVLWENGDYPKWGVHTRGGPQPSLADLDGDGFPEVVIGNCVLNGTNGSLRWDGVVTSGGKGGIGNNAFLGPVSTVADIDLLLPLAPEVIAGNTVYDAKGKVLWTYKLPSGYCQGTLPCDGFNAVGNFDGDDEGEVVIIAMGVIHILEHDGKLKLKIDVPWQDCMKGTNVANESGPPTVADFDGDGKPEIGTAGADYYAVADLDCVGSPLPKGCASKYIRWNTPNQDCSSRATASSVFDFEGDGKAEVVYADETTFRIFDGATGKILFTDDTHGSNTRLEMPVIADVDNDGSAEVVIPENQNGGGTPGIDIWDDADGNWVRSRRIWNQHSYHITNISEDGVVPKYEAPNWLAGYNNFRQNIQPTGIHWASDLFVESADVQCGWQVTVSACIGNKGMLGVPPGVTATGKLQIVDGPTVKLGPAKTEEPILPGQCRNVVWNLTLPSEVTFDWTYTLEIQADDDGTPNGGFNECKEDNNGAKDTGSCPYVTPDSL